MFEKQERNVQKELTTNHLPFLFRKFYSYFYVKMNKERINLDGKQNNHSDEAHTYVNVFIQLRIENFRKKRRKKKREKFQRMDMTLPFFAQWTSAHKNAFRITQYCRNVWTYNGF